MATFAETKLKITNILCTISGLADGPETASKAIRSFRIHGADTDPGDLGTVGGCTILQFFNDVDAGYTDDIKQQLLRDVNDQCGSTLADPFKIDANIDQITRTVRRNLAP